MQSDAGSCGHSSSEFKEPTHAGMPEINVVAEHHRTGAGDDTDLVLTAILDGIRRNTRSLPYGLVHPDAADAGIIAVVHNVRGDFRPRDDHHAIDTAGDGLQVGIAVIAIEGLHVRIHWED